MSCPVDVDEWRKENRITLHPKRLYRWTLVRTDRDEPTEDDVELTAKAVMAKWFSSDIVTGGGADVQKVSVLSGPYGPKGGVRREQLPGMPPTVRVVKAPIYVVVDWASRFAGQIDIPWPTRRGGPVQLIGDAQCPVDADWILQESQDIGDAPPPLGVGERVARAAESAAAAVTSGAEGAAKGIFRGLGWGLVGVAVIGAGVYALSRFREQREQEEV